MEIYETSATVEGEGQVHVAGVPFEPGTEVEVTISPKRRPAEEFTAAWRRLCEELRTRTPDLRDEDIQEEIGRYRCAE